MGSSPRMRGKLGVGGGGEPWLGLIPAHAGKTSDASGDAQQPPAHPRACGENPSFWRRLRLIPGSSPRMRGKRGRHGPQRPRRRLIPAHAGKTPTLTVCSVSQRAHPRACGENMISCVLWLVAPGSSPRMRGKRSPSRPGWRDSGLIPAHAGKTRQALQGGSGQPAHPRACGENPLFYRLAGPGVWLIPAHAGKTLPSPVQRR